MHLTEYVEKEQEPFDVTYAFLCSKSLDKIAMTIEKKALFILSNQQNINTEVGIRKEYPFLNCLSRMLLVGY